MKSADRSYMNRVLAGGRFQADGFELPNKQRIFRSVRFGEHGFALDQECLRILPVGVESDAEERAPGARPSGLNRTLSNGRTRGANATRPVASWPGKVMNVFFGCKSYAASFFW